MMIIYKEFGIEEIDSVKEIYKEVSWNAYLHDNKTLVRAYQNSLFCLGAFKNDILIGFIRCVGDGEHIVLVQDLIVLPDFQHQYIGSTLFKKVLDKYKNVRMIQVNTDIDDEVSNKFYISFGLEPISSGNMISYFKK